MATSSAVAATASMANVSSSPALCFKVLAQCSKSKARTSLMKLPHYTVELPMFMPVGTQGTMKGLLPEQIKDAKAQIILGNTYHLGTRPGKDLLSQVGGLHNFMQWDRAILTDSGGFQMVSLMELSEVTEDGVKFKSPFDGSECMLTPEESIEIQNAIGGDIMMQLDDVVDVKEKDYERFKTATYRTTRWLDRCMKANKHPDRQNLFPIIQGGLFPDLRKISLEQLIARDAPGYAVGGLSGGEEKEKFWSTVHLCTDHLPKNKPRYCMGVGFAVDLVVCCALGVDMFDCVYPTRTARFGCALVDNGQINLKSKEFAEDFRPIDAECDCSTCQNYTRAYLNTIVTKETVACHLLSVHNIAYQMKLMENIRQSIKEGRFVQFVENFMASYYKDVDYPKWVVDALAAVNIHLKKSSRNPELRDIPPGLDDIEDNDEGTVELKSDFEKLYTTGYRNAILGDFDQEERDGKLLAFQRGFQSLPTVNPTLLLAKIDGILIGCLIKHKSILNEEQKNELCRIQDTIKKLLLQCNEPSDEHLEAICSAGTGSDMSSKSVLGSCEKEKCCSSADQCIDKTNASEVSAAEGNGCCSLEKKITWTRGHILDVVTRAKAFCHGVGWKFPEEDLIPEL